uniref:DUF148 domain-containing protein n=1 Tax=Rhabditophanes sp. KR3021 TaxID=114890 RepID=A0AC35U199_9BILA
MFKCIVLVAVITTVAYAEVSREQLDQCYEGIANQNIKLWGDFADVSQHVRALRDGMNMYYQNKAIPEIVQYQIQNQGKYLSSDQIAKANKCIDSLSVIFGSSKEALSMMQKLFESALNFIIADQAKVDQQIADDRKQNKPETDMKLNTCHLVSTLITPEKKKEIIAKFKNDVPADKYDAVFKEVSVLINLN